jgi:hypothetical protein
MMMARTFTKLFNSITESTIWVAPDTHRITFIAMLAMADQHGRIWGSIPGLANRARVPVEDARAAIASFLAPDPDSRTKDFEGRRIEEIDGGWRLLNHAKYREMRDADDRREYQREWDRKNRTRPKSDSESDRIRQIRHDPTEAYTEAVKPLRPSGEDQSGFDDFWKAYPRKVKKRRAQKTWLVLKPDNQLVQIILRAVERHKASEWTPDRMQYVPHPSTWLVDRRWEDEQETAPKSERRLVL